MRNKKGVQNQLGFFLGIIIIVALGVSTLIFVADTKEEVDRAYASTTTDFIYLSSLNLQPTNLVSTSETFIVKNETWLDFNKTNGYINASDFNYADGVNQMTWSGFFKANSFVDNAGVFGKYAAVADGRSYIIRLTNSDVITILLSQDGAATESDSSSSTLNCSVNETNVWQHIAIVYNSTHVIYYKDGRKCNQDPTAISSIFNSTQPATIGLANGVYFNGSVDNVRIYNYSLPDSQVKRLYDAEPKVSGYGISIPTIVYHQVVGVDDATDKVHTDNFSLQMNYLYTHGFETITYDQYLSWRNGNFVLPEKPIIIAFDDGTTSAYQNATPIMDSYEFVGNMNVITSSVGNKPYYMTWAEIQDLYNKGWQIGSHSINATQLTTLTNDDLIYVFNQSKNDIIGNLSITPTLFTYPSNANNDTIDSICSNYYTFCSGHSYGIDTGGINLMTYETSNLTHETGLPIGLRRLRIDNITTLENFIREIENDDFIQIDYKLNEQVNTTIYDSSGKGNNGTSLKSVWVNDGIDVTLRDGLDYNLTGSNFEIFNSKYEPSFVSGSLSYYTYKNSFSKVGLMITEIMIAIIIIVFIIGYIIKEDIF